VLFRSQEEKAAKLIKNYKNIAKLYIRAKKLNPNLIFSIITQRRYHPAYDYIKREVTEVFRKTNCPVTHSYFYHSDGQWRLPKELLLEQYHGYNRGIGKCSHSGYHFFDLLAQIMKTQTNNKKPDYVSVESSFVRPNDLLEQLTLDDYNLIFKDFPRYNKEKLKAKMKKYGEVDASIHFNFIKNGQKISFSDMNLVHNGFSNRSWLNPKEDLYKGNGRLRHEHHIITQGPFQSIHYHSYQSDETNNKKLNSSENSGGELHFEVHIYRNKKILSTNKPQFEIIDYSKFKIPKDGIYLPRGHQEYSKYLCIIDFFNNCQYSGIDKSDYLDHYHSHLLYSLSYISAARSFNKKNKKVMYKW